ncbi:hypothetical protein BV96_01106 [Sphingomonas paucimobilis]|nr:hypothetical protein BV96_01106 [Sphingomonas paucimobilis]
MGKLFTVGYSGLEMQGFVALLRANHVNVVCDVRSMPYSKYKPDFSRAPFKAGLNAAGIKYTFLGDQLGARPKDRACYVNGQATYERISKSDFFKSGLDRIRTGSAMMNLAIVCSESDPIECHRAILVCRNLDDIRDRIAHIHGNGQIEDQRAFDARLVEMHGLTPPPLLQEPGDWERAVGAAYKKQGDGIAFQERYPAGSKDE